MLRVRSIVPMHAPKRVQRHEHIVLKCFPSIVEFGGCVTLCCRGSCAKLQCHNLRMVLGVTRCPLLIFRLQTWRYGQVLFCNLQATLIDDVVYSLYQKVGKLSSVLRSFDEIYDGTVVLDYRR